MNEALINLLRQNRTEKVGEKKRKKDTISYNCQVRNTSGGAAARSIAAVQQCGRIIKWWEQRWRRRWWYYLHNLQDSLHKTDGEMWWKLGSIRYMRWIYLTKVLIWEIFLQMIFFVVSALDHKYLDYISVNYAMREKSPQSEFFWSVFSRIQTEYGEIRSIAAFHTQGPGN